MNTLKLTAIALAVTTAFTCVPADQAQASAKKVWKAQNIVRYYMGDDGKWEESNSVSRTFDKDGRIKTVNEGEDSPLITRTYKTNKVTTIREGRGKVVITLKKGRVVKEVSYDSDDKVKETRTYTYKIKKGKVTKRTAKIRNASGKELNEMVTTYSYWDAKSKVVKKEFSKNSEYFPDSKTVEYYKNGLVKSDSFDGLKYTYTYYTSGKKKGELKSSTYTDALSTNADTSKFKYTYTYSGDKKTRVVVSKSTNGGVYKKTKRIDYSNFKKVPAFSEFLDDWGNMVEASEVISNF